MISILESRTFSKRKNPRPPRNISVINIDKSIGHGGLFFNSTAVDCPLSAAVLPICRVKIRLGFQKEDERVKERRNKEKDLFISKFIFSI
jgi:hypothetical protein